ncbi:MAG: hypothetical protein ACOY33_12125 [Pseudomonadota bacterium]
MKIRYVLGLTALLAMPLVQAGEEPPMPGPMMMDPVESPEAQQDLKLTDDQKKQVQAIHQDARAKHEAIRKETHEKVKAVLTPEQYNKLEEMRAKRMERREERMERRLDRHEDRVDRRKERMENRKEHMAE